MRYAISDILSAGFLKRFWDKVRKKDNDSCWEWMAYRTEAGYGQIGIKGHRGPLILSHRASWIIHNGKIPDKLFVCHRCDNPPCVNPYHLYLGTSRENTQDAARKGAFQKKLTVEDVKEIRKIYATRTIPQWKIGKMFGVGQAAISVAVGKKWWKYVSF